VRFLWSACAAVAAAGVVAFAGSPEVLRSIGGIPPHVAGVFQEPYVFQQTASGTYLVFDRRAHAVYLIDRGRTEARRIVDIGPESGRLLGPTAFDSRSDGTFVVADGPNRVERIQFFDASGERVGGFRLPGRATPRVILGTLVLSGVGSLQLTGRSLLINQPERGALVTEYNLAGAPIRTFGALRPTGHEDDRDVHLALNVGLPLVDPTGGYYFVFQTGEPRFRKYGRDGDLVFERVLQGREIDALMRAAPSEWPRRTVEGESLPLVPPVVRTAAVDPDGQLWIVLVVPYTHVFDRDGDLVRRVQFEAAGIMSPSSLFFPARGRLLIAPGLYEFSVN
jgi:hypothetical protein